MRRPRKPLSPILYPAPPFRLDPKVSPLDKVKMDTVGWDWDDIPVEQPRLEPDAGKRSIYDVAGLVAFRAVGAEGSGRPKPTRETVSHLIQSISKRAGHRAWLDTLIGQTSPTTPRQRRLRRLYWHCREAGFGPEDMAFFDRGEPVRYQSSKVSKSIRTLKHMFGCRPGVLCEPARLASRFDDLPWTHMVTLAAPDGRFSKVWTDWWAGMERFCILLSRDRAVGRPFYLGTVALKETGEGHASLVFGNITADDMRFIVAQWPYRVSAKVQPIDPKVGGRWGAIHYQLNQTGRQYHYADEKGYSHAVRDLLCSDNLEAWWALMDRAIRRTAARKAALKREWGKPGQGGSMFEMVSTRNAANARKGWEQLRAAKTYLAFVIATLYTLAGSDGQKGKPIESRRVLPQVNIG